MRTVAALCLVCFLLGSGDMIGFSPYLVDIWYLDIIYRIVTVQVVAGREYAFNFPAHICVSDDLLDIKLRDTCIKSIVVVENIFFCEIVRPAIDWFYAAVSNDFPCRSPPGGSGT